MAPFLLSFALALSAVAAPAAPMRVVVVGDSLTEGLGVQKHEAYPALLQKKFEAEKLPVEIINMGTSGATSASGPSRVKFALKMKPAPQALVLALGGNDALRGLDATAMKRNLREAITLAQAAGLQVFIAGMKMPYNFPEAQCSRFGAVFRELAEEKRTGLLPFLLEGVAADRTLNQADQVHPNPQGHQKIADHLFIPLRKFLKL